MKVKNLKMIAIMVCIVPVSVFGQIPTVNKIIPEGKWELIQESVNAIIGCRHECYMETDPKDEHVHINQEVNVKNLDFDMYTELEVKQDIIILKSSEKMLNTKYIYTNKEGITYDSKDIPFNSGGNVYGNKLYVQQRMSNPTNEKETIYISFIYEHKPE